MQDVIARLNRFIEAVASDDWQTALELAKSDQKTLAVLAWAEANADSLKHLTVEQVWQDGVWQRVAIATAPISKREVQKGAKLIETLKEELKQASLSPTTMAFPKRKVKEFDQRLKKIARSIRGFRGRPPGDALARRALAAQVLELNRRQHLSMVDAVTKVAKDAKLNRRTIWRYVAEYREAAAQQTSADLPLGTPPARPNSARPRQLISDDPAIIESEKAWVDAAGRRETTKYPSNAPRSKPRTSPA
jgi:hypothetical protein